MRGGTKTPWVRPLLVAALVVATACALAAQGTAADYARAQAARGRFQGLVVDVAGAPNWIEGGDQFWYRTTVKGGYQFVLVDPDTATKKPAFDHARMATALSQALGHDYTAVTLPFTEPPAAGGRGGGVGIPASAALHFVDNLQAIEFGVDGFMWKCTLDSYTCTKGEAIPTNGRGGRGAFGGRGRGGAGTGRGGGAVEDPNADTFSGDAADVDLLASPYVSDPDIESGVDYPTQQSLSPQAQAATPPAGGRGLGDNSPLTESTSPDGQWDAVILNYNVFLKKHGAPDSDATPLSYDGSEGNYYTLRSVAWSHNSKYLVAYHTRPGYQRHIQYVESSPTDQVQPIAFTGPLYNKPGDALDIAAPALFEIANKKETSISDALFPNAFSLSRAQWWKDDRGFTFEYNQRGHQVFRVIEVSATTGVARTLIEETSKTFIDYRDLSGNRTDSGKRYRYDLDDGQRIIWASERNGWEHLYMYDGTTGKVLYPITQGNWVVRYVDWVDEANKQIYFRASGMNAGQDPYFVQYYRINFDGTGLVPLTEANGEHTVSFSPDHKYYVDSWSTVDQPATSQLRRTADQKVLLDLGKGDDSALLAAGWQPPLVFTAKGRDGVTDIWGVIFRPSNFDPAKKYHVIENIYAGPQGSFVPKTFTGTAQPLAEVGFVVVQIDGMGTNNRSRAFHDVAYKNLADAGLPDRILWHKAAAAKYPWYDISGGIGVYGTSAGGQNSLGALLFHPEFYKVGVSNSGCHDNRMDKIWWNEQWMGWPIGPQYAEDSNVDNAWRLQGKLLLVMGELDNNVDPSSTLQVVNQLIKHNKRFDFLEVPGGGHGAGGAYGQHLLEDFFVHNLMGVEPPEWNEAPDAHVDPAAGGAGNF